MNRVYRYACSPPKTETERVIKELRGNHELRNRLVEIERERRKAVRALCVDLPELAAAQACRAVLDEALATIKKVRSETKKRSESAEDTKRAKEARRAYQETLRALTLARRARLSACEAEIKAVNDASAKREKEAYGESPVEAWGSKLDVFAAHAAVRAMPYWDELVENDPHFVRWEGEGQIAVQLQGGLRVGAALSGGDRRFQLAELVPEAFEGTDAAKNPREKRRLRGAVGRLRIGSDARNPIWTEVRVQVHRLLPEDGLIKWARLSRRRVALSYAWSLEITVDVPLSAVVRPGVVGLDLGWRKKPDGSLRVGYIAVRESSEQEHSNRHRELVLPASLVQRFSRLREAESERTHAFEMARMRLVDWVSAFAELPDWLKEESKTLAQWRSPARLARLVRTWGKPENRFERDELPYERLRGWAAGDALRYQENEEARQSALRAREWYYGNWAAECANAHGVLAVENMNISRMIRHRDPDADEPAHEERARSRAIASPGRLRQVFTHAFEGRGGIVMLRPARNTTVTCPTCGDVRKFDAAEILAPTCTNGHTIDQDERAARNLCEGVSGEEIAEAARTREVRESTPKESRWAKIKRMKREKEKGALARGVGSAG
jgi:hypothetical protein